MKDVIRKAMANSQKRQNYIKINHLSPNRNLRHFQENEDQRMKEASEKLQEVSVYLKNEVGTI